VRRFVPPTAVALVLVVLAAAATVLAGRGAGQSVSSFQLISHRIGPGVCAIALAT
jgi:hypothetical protein